MCCNIGAKGAIIITLDGCRLANSDTSRVVITVPGSRCEGACLVQNRCGLPETYWEGKSIRQVAQVGCWRQHSSCSSQVGMLGRPGSVTGRTAVAEPAGLAAGCRAGTWRSHSPGTEPPGASSYSHLQHHTPQHYPQLNHTISKSNIHGYSQKSNTRIWAIWLKTNPINQMCLINCPKALSNHTLTIQSAMKNVLH